MNTPTRSLLALALVASLAACGGGDGAVATTTSPSVGASGSTTITAAPLVVSAATPSTVNGTLNVALVTGMNESGVSNSTGVYSGTNDYCRVAIYSAANSGDSQTYDIQVIFAKSDKAASYISLSRSGASLTYTVRAAAPISGFSVNTSIRRIAFSGVVLGAGGTNAATLTGTLDYAPNAADAANCG